VRALFVIIGSTHVRQEWDAVQNVAEVVFTLLGIGATPLQS
jgi:hypothetical protein